MGKPPAGRCERFAEGIRRIGAVHALPVAADDVLGLVAAQRPRRPEPEQRMHGERLVTNGGRILNVTALAATLDEAREQAYACCAEISFDGMRFRRDIAAPEVNVAG